MNVQDGAAGKEDHTLVLSHEPGRAFPKPQQFPKPQLQPRGHSRLRSLDTAIWFWSAAVRAAGPAHSPQRQDAVLAEAVPAAGLVRVVKHRVAEGAFVAFFQLLHKLVLCVGLKVQGNGVARILADEGTGDNPLLL